MSRIEGVFARAKADRRKALVTFLCVGDPSIEESIAIAIAMAEEGADVIELGVPFSDPTADGPAIARAAERAIRGGATILRVIDAAAAIRARTSVPLVLFTYTNPLLVTGERAVIDRAHDAGIDALLVVDLPPEEGAEARAYAADRGLAWVPLMTPTSDDARAKVILAAVPEAAPRGFLYYVSMTGITGSTPTDLRAASSRAEALRALSGWPVVVGFGIDGPDAARAASGDPSAGADGVVVGSAIVRRIERGQSAGEREASVRSLVRDLRSALDNR